jgi:GNAT superfamily N-acetyltransferase
LVTDLALGYRLTHYARTFDWENAPGVNQWSVELVVRDGAPGARREIIIGVADFVCADTVECDDFVVDLDSMGRELGEMAHVVLTTVMTDGGIFTLSNIRVLFATFVILDPHWRGRGFGPALVKMTARALGGVDLISLMPSALATSRNDAGYWEWDTDKPRPGRTAQAKVRAAWKAAGFTRRVGQVYILDLDDERSTNEAQLARAQLSAYAFSPADKEWWAANLIA